MLLQILLSKALRLVTKNRWLIGGIFVGIGVVCILILFAFEGLGHQFQTPADYLSWWLGTVTTTGAVAMPETEGGKIVDAILKIPLFLSGFGFLAALFSWVIETVTRAQRGLGTYRGREHLLVVGWNETIRALLKTLPKTAKVVLLADNLEGVLDQVDQFIRGDPTLDETLLRAGVADAKQVVIALEDDGITGLTAASVQRLNPEATMIAIAIEEENIDRLTEVGAQVICPTKTVADQITYKIGFAQGQVGGSTENRPIVFGAGPITKVLSLLGSVIILDTGDPAVDFDLVEAGIREYTVAVAEPRDDSHGWLAVSSIRAQNEGALIIAVCEREENKPHLKRAGAEYVFCPTQVAVKEILKNL